MIGRFAVALAVAFGLAVTVWAEGCDAAELKPALSASVSFTPLGSNDALIAPKMPFEITVAIHNHASTDPPVGLRLFGWLRRIDRSNLSCSESAESFFRSGRLPVGAVFLNDPLVAMLTEDNSVLMVDAEFSLASANIVAAEKLSSRPAGMTVDQDLRRLLIPLPDEGRVVAIDTGGQLSELAAGLDRPTIAVPAPNGGVYILTKHALVRVPAGPVPKFAAEAATLVAGRTWAVIRNHDAVTLFDLATGATQLEHAGPSDAAIGLVDPDAVFGLAIAKNAALAVTYLDAVDEPPIVIPLGAPAKALVQSRDGRFLFAYDPSGGPVSVIDLALSRLVQTTAAGDTAIADIVVGESAAYLMLADQTRIGVLELVSLANQGVAEFREVPFGAARDEPLVGQRLLTSLWPDSGILAVHAESHQGYRLQDYAAMGNAPAMSAIPLRGGVPREVVAVDRSFREGSIGTFRTVTGLPGPGRWELVATTGLGALSFCAEVPVREPDDDDPAVGRLTAVSADPSGAIQLRTLDGDGLPIMVSGTVTFAALSGAWKDRAQLETDANGLSKSIYELPRDQAVVLTVQSNDSPFDPLLLEPDR